MDSYTPVPARRGSLIGPLILVMLGVLFLLSNFRPDLSVWSVFARYWPYLLIVWGVARIAEYTIARVSGRPIGRTLTGGEVFLVILICLFGSGLVAANRYMGWFPRIGHRGIDVFAESYDYPLSAGQPVTGNATVVINNLNGNINVSGTDSKELKITGRKSIRAISRSDADRADKATPLDVSADGDRIYIRTNQDRGPGSGRVTCDLEISVPRGVAVSLDGRNGDLQVRDLAGPVDINSNSASVRLNNIAKDVRVSLRRSDLVRAEKLQGSIDISGHGRDIDLDLVAGKATINGDFSGSIKLQKISQFVHYTSSQTDLSFEKLPGTMEMDLGQLRASNIAGPLRLTARSKDVRIDDFTSEVDITSRRGDIDLRTTRLPVSDIHAESHNGDITLQLPAAARFTLQGSAVNGRADNEFGGAIHVVEKGNSAELSGGNQPGSGPAAQIRLSTERGGITVKRSG